MAVQLYSIHSDRAFSPYTTLKMFSTKSVTTFQFNEHFFDLTLLEFLVPFITHALMKFSLSWHLCLCVFLRWAACGN